MRRSYLHGLVLLAACADFKRTPDIIVGQVPEAIVAGDLDNDGNLDLVTTGSVVTGSVFQDMSVLMGKGDGRFEVINSDSRAFTPRRALALADMNNDGALDLLLTGSLLLGNGDGSFQPPQSFPSNGHDSSIAVGDFNDDGALDVAVSGPGDGLTEPSGVSILLGDGTGALHPQEIIRLGFMVATEDMNNDGKLDLVTRSRDHVNVQLGNGDGSFQAPLEFSVGVFLSPFNAITIGDFNSDSRPDVVTINFASNEVETLRGVLLLGNGDGSLQEGILFGREISSKIMLSTDLNGDGFPELIATRDSEVLVFFGDGRATLLEPLALKVEPTPKAVAFGDFNNDGALDLAAAGPENVIANRPCCDGVVSVLLGSP